MPWRREVEQLGHHYSCMLGKTWADMQCMHGMYVCICNHRPQSVLRCRGGGGAIRGTQTPLALSRLHSRRARPATGSPSSRPARSAVPGRTTPRSLGRQPSQRERASAATADGALLLSRVRCLPLRRALCIRLPCVCRRPFRQHVRPLFVVHQLVLRPRHSLQLEGVRRAALPLPRSLSP
mgnify:CR=1 FL=1